MSKMRGYDKTKVLADVLYDDPDCSVQDWPGFIRFPTTPVDRQHNAQLRAKIMARFRKAFTDRNDVSNHLYAFLG